MKKTVKKLKSYYLNQFDHSSQLEAIKQRTGFFEIEKNKKTYMPFVFATSLAIVIAVPLTASIVINSFSSDGESIISPMKNRLKKCLVTMDFNPSISFTIDENGVVNSLYGENDEGKMIVLDEDLNNKDYEYVIAKIIDVEKKLGYLVPEKDQNYSLTIYNEESFNINELNESISSYCQKIGLKTTIEIKSSVNYNDLMSNVFSFTENLSSFDEHYNYLVKYYENNKESITKDYEEFNSLYNHYATQIAYYKAAVAELNNKDLEGFVNLLENKFEEYMNSYFTNFIESDSAYQKYFNQFIDEKANFLLEQSEGKNTEEAEAKIDKCLNTLKTYKDFVTNNLLKPRLEKMENEIDVIVNYFTDNSLNIEENKDFKAKQNQYFDNMKNDFYTKKKYKNCLENIYQKLINKKTMLIDKISK